MKNKKKISIIIIGGTSFVGKNLINLLKKKFDLAITFFKKKINLPKYISIYKFSFENKNFLNKLDKFDIIIHLATQKKLLSKKNLNNEILFFDRITDYCLNKEKKFIYLSSSLIYKKKIINDEASEKINCHENKYVNLKVYFDQLILKKKELGLKVLMLRVPSVYGPNLTNVGIVNLSKKKLLLNKTVNFFKPVSNSIRLVYINDICKVIKKSINLKINGVYNLESGENIKVIDIIKCLKKKLKSKSKINVINEQIKNINYPKLNILKIKNTFRIVPQKKFMNLLNKIK